VLALAHEEAHYYMHNYIGTEHLLLGILREGEGVAARALDSLRVSLPAVREAVRDMIGHEEHPTSDEPLPPPGWMPYVPRLRKVLSLAAEEAQRLGHDHVGTEHLLLAIVREGEGVAAKILERFGAFDEAARVQTLALLKPRDTDGQD
jgi:ATP-dependent Clp protease ATP-binding subunit ClpC